MSFTYSFHSPELETLAMTHRGVDGTINNQRLEFLGDRVLGLVIADMLYKHFPDAREGDMAIRHAKMVCRDTLVSVAIDSGIQQQLVLSSSEEQSGGRDTLSTLEDACEAYIGAMYLDGGLAAAETFIHHYWHTLLQQSETPVKDAKTQLQEWAQSHGLALPEYTEIHRVGAAHNPLFTIQVTVEGLPPACAQATSKRIAAQEAAGLLLSNIQETVS